jgi:hypothetical protein
MAVLDLAAIGWIWFVVGLCLLLARAEGVRHGGPRLPWCPG